MTKAHEMDQNRPYDCRTCGQHFPTSLHRTRHEVDAHPEPEPTYDFACIHGCGVTKPSRKALRTHELLCNRNDDPNR